MDEQPSQGPPLRVMIAEDHGLMLEAIVNRLRADDIDVVEAVADGRALVEAYTRLHAAGTPPDLVLSDFGMPRLNGLQATEEILALDPEAKILILSANEDDSLVVLSMAAGAVGFLLKSLPPGELQEKVRSAARGEPVFDARTFSAMIGQVRRQRGPVGTASGPGAPLSPREVEVLILVSEGLSNAEVGQRLYISGQTVKTHLERIFTKLGVSGRTAAVKRGIETGVIRTG
ncbi:MAG: response regulator [Acidimicrobiia bacterium]